MHTPTNDIIGRQIECVEDRFGRVTDIYFDDQSWHVKYLVVDTGGWFTGRKVLIAPESVTDVPPGGDTITVSLTRQQVESSPGVVTHEPLNRRPDLLVDEYGWSAYWVPMTGSVGQPMAVPVPTRGETGPEPAKGEGPTLLSVAELRGSRALATDGEVKHVSDLVVEIPGWTICQVALSTGLWPYGRKVLVPLSSVGDVDWCDRRMEMELSSEGIDGGPELRRDQPIAETCEAETAPRRIPRGFCAGEELLGHPRSEERRAA